MSSLTTTEQPYSSLSHLHHTRVTCHVSLDTCQDSHRISRRLSRFLRILGTGFSSAMEMLRLSTGQVCCLLSHCTMQSAQNACSHLRKYNLKLIKYFYMAVLMCKIVFIKSTNLTSIGANSLWRQAGVLEHGAADGADELLVHRALEPGHLVAHPPLLGSAPASSPEEDNTLETHDKSLHRGGEWRGVSIS